jgi:DNA-binding SARP family transcriptional activator
MRIQVLGAVRAWRGETQLELGPPRQRGLLGLLALAGGRPVPRDELLDALWEGRPPASAPNMIQSCVKRLRRVLEPDRLRYRSSAVLPLLGDGYALQVPPESIDALVFRNLVSTAAGLHRTGRPGEAASTLAEALGLWQGRALADVSLLARHPKVVGLAAERHAALLRYGTVLIGAGDLAEALPILQEIAGDQPLDEAAHAWLIRAHHGLGRRADAFAVYHAIRRRLADELGVDPGAELAAAHDLLLHSEPPAAATANTATANTAAANTAATNAAAATTRTAYTATHTAAAAEPAAPVPAAGPGQSELAQTGDRPEAMHPLSARIQIPAQLPSDIHAFAGRDGHLRQLDDILAGAATAAPRAVVISAVSGTAGVGKTALAVHWAHRVADRFPDGQLYVNLRGFDPGGHVIDPTEALRRFLEALDVPAHRIPASVDAQTALYRSRLAGRRMLILLDNARDSAHVRPLLPGTATCLVVVTSRSQLLGLVAAEGAYPVTLDLLTLEESWQLLSHRLGAPRIGAEPSAAIRIISRCVRLPLALAVVAARAATTPHQPLQILAEQLEDDRGRLDTLTSTGDANTNVRGVFSWSYRALTPPAAALMRLLGLHPGPDLTAPAAVSLAGLRSAQVRPLLTELSRAHLVNEHSPGRYSFHDLLRDYATEQALTTESDQWCRAATHRVLDHYLHTAHAAACLLDRHRDPISVAPARPGVTPEQFDRHEAAQHWLAAENAVLLAVIQHAAANDWDRHTWQLAWSLATFFERRGQWHDWAHTQRLALTAARRLADPAAESLAHRHLGRAYTQLGRLQDAHTHLRHALDLAVRIGDRVGQARTHNSFTLAWERQRQYPRALEHARLAFDLFEAVGHRDGQAYALGNIGWYHALLGRYDEALSAAEVAVRLGREIGDQHGEAASWDTLGYAHHHLGHHNRAIACYQHAIALYRDMGDLYWEAIVLTHLADTHHSTGSQAPARDAWQRALAILTDLNHPEADQVRATLARS